MKPLVKPREALLMVPGFARAEVLSELVDGVASVAWLVESDAGQFVLRVDKPAAEQLGLDRESEREVGAVVAQAGLGPETVFHDAARGVSLRRFVPGRCWTDYEIQGEENLAKLARALRDLHALAPAGAIYEPGTAARRYAQHLGTAEARIVADEANVLLADLRYDPYRECLCHNDLVAANIIESGKGLVLIDWEFAGIGDPWFDLAVVIGHHKLGAGPRATLVNAYLRREPSVAEAERLDKWCRFYDALLLLWLLRTSPWDGGQPD